MGDETQFLAVHPVLPVRDVAESALYYEKLGFSVFIVDSKYAVISRENVEMHLQWHDNAGFNEDVDQLMLRFYIRDLDALVEEFRLSGAMESSIEIRETPWGTREFAFYDPDGNGLTFYRSLGDS